MDCIFCRIIAGEIPSSKVYEDEYCYAFRDINPQTPVHLCMQSAREGCPSFTNTRARRAV